VIRYLGSVGSSGVGDDTADRAACGAGANNRFDQNTYLGATDQVFLWCVDLRWDGFQSVGQEPNGTFSTP
jgi:hypothetical protein